MLVPKYTERVTFTINSGVVVAPVGLGAIIDPAKTIISNMTGYQSGGVPVENPRSTLFILDLTTNSIFFRRISGADDVQMTMTCDLIEFTAASNINVTRVQSSSTSADFNIGISAVDLNNTFLLQQGMSVDGTLMSQDDTAEVSFTSSTNINVRKFATPSSGELRLQIIESSDLSVQHTLATLASTDGTVAFSGIDPANTLAFVSGRINQAFDSRDRYSFNVESGQVRFRKPLASSWDLSIFAVTFLPSAGVHFIEHVGRFTTGASIGNINIGQIDQSKSWLASAGNVQQLYLECTDASGTPNINGADLSISSDIALVFHRNSPTGTMAFAPQIIEFGFSPGAWQSKIGIKTISTFINSTVNDYVALIDEAQVDAHFWANVQDGGGDIRITTDTAGLIEIPIEIQDCNTSNETLRIWTIMPSITADGEDTLYIWYDTILPVTGYDEDAPFGRNNVWVDYTAVYHHNETLGTLSSIDSTGNSHSGTYTKTSGTFADPKPFQNTVAQDFEQTDGKYINIPDDTALDFTNSIAVQVWCNWESFDSGAWANIISKGDSAWRMTRDNVSNKLHWACTGVVGGFAVTSTFDINDTNPQYLICWYNGNVLATIKNATDAQFFGGRSGTIDTNIFNVQIGHNEEAVGRFWDGLIGDVRIGPIKNSERFTADYYNQVDTTNFWEEIPLVANVRAKIKGNVDGNVRGGIQ